MPRKMKKALRRNNGEGSIYQKADLTWICQITIGRKPDGRLDRKSWSGQTEESVRVRRDKWLAENPEIAAKLSLPISGVVRELETLKKKVAPQKPNQEWLFNDWFLHWIKQYKTPPLVHHRTYSGYMDNYLGHVKPFFEGAKLSEVDIGKMQAFYNSLSQNGARLDKKPGGLSPKTIQNIHVMVRSCLDQALEEEFIEKNPTTKTKRPEVIVPEARVLSPNEMKIFLGEVMKETQRMLMIFALFTGLRLGELCALQWDDIDMEEHTVKISKTVMRIRLYDQEGPKTKIIVQDYPKSKSSRRTVPLNEAIFHLLMRHRSKLMKVDWPNPNDLLFPSRNGTHLEGRSVQLRFKAVCKRCELQKVSPHTCRHTFATRLIEQEAHLRTVQELLGHASSQTTSRYAHVMTETKRSAVGSLEQYVPISDRKLVGF